MRNRKESKKLKERIIDLYVNGQLSTLEGGLSQNKISQKLGISRAYVYLVLKSENLI